MEEVSPPIDEENGLENHDKTHCKYDHVLGLKPSNSNIMIQSENVTVQRINYDTSVITKKEKSTGFKIDEEEGELQEDDSSRDNQGRKNISTLTSRHYAGHVRVFKGTKHLYLNTCNNYSLIPRFFSPKLNNLFL